MEITLTINGEPRRVDAPARQLLVHTLRDTFRLTGAHIGCDTSQCGACTVLIDGRAVRSCTKLTVQAEGCEVRTIEGMKSDRITDALKQAFNQVHGLQCGYCTPAMILASRALLEKTLDPSEHQVRDALHGNLCRCTGYQNIVDAVLLGARTLREPPQPLQEERSHG